jgi:hypothetical protein
MTLVSILGDFHSSILPISYEFKKEITKHIIVYDDAHTDREKLKRIVAGQKAFFATLQSNSEYHYEVRTIQIDEDSYKSIIGCYNKILKIEPNYKSIYLNTTDGLSSIAIILSSKLLAIGAKIISYDRYDNTYNLHTQTSMTHNLIKNSMDIQSHLLMKGYSIEETVSKSEVNSRKNVVLELCKDLSHFKGFADKLNHVVSVKDIEGYKRCKKLLKSIAKLDNKSFIQGSVFEEYIYHLIVDNFNFDDVWLGTKVRFSELVENEFDLLMIKDNHLHTIECKFQLNVNGNALVYKVEPLMNYLDDDGKAMIVNIRGSDKIDKRTKQKKLNFNNATKHRARYGDILIHQDKNFDEKRFLSDVEKWFCK